MAEETTASAEARTSDTEELIDLVRGFRFGGTSQPARRTRRAA